MSVDTVFLPYARHEISKEDIAAVSEALAGEVITRGPRVAEFEAALASYCGADYAVAYNSGSTALHAACYAAKVGPGDRLITTPNSFVATAVSGVARGATPIFIDVDPETGNMDLAKLEPNICEPLSRGRNIILPVHYAGIPLDVRRLNSLVRDPYTVIIEDAAAALGTAFDRENRVGSCAWSDMTVFSFHPAKLITTGEGGLVTTNNSEMAHRLRAYRNNGIERDPSYLKDCPGPWFYEAQEMAGNYHLTDFQAALGLSQFGRIDNIIDQKKQIIEWYRQHLTQAKLLEELCDPRVSPHLAVVRIDFEASGKTRAQVMAQLAERGIGSQVHYIPIYRHPVFKRINGEITDYFPGMELFYQQALSLPLCPSLKEEDVKRVCHALHEILRSK